MINKLFILISVFFWTTFSFGQMDEEVLLIARNTGKKVVATGDTIRTMGFALSLMENPPVPGPTLEFVEGDSIEIDLWNVSQGAPHTIHLHGLDVNQQNDGVPHLSFDVGHMDHGFYKFKAPQAGTYLYHCHVVSTIHVQAGMYGLIIVHPADESQTTWTGGYEYDVSMSLMMSEIDTVWHNDTIIKHEYDSTLAVHKVELPYYDPQFYLVNGYSDEQIPEEGMALNTAVDAVNYIRLINIGYKGNRVVFPPSFEAKIIDSDGRPLPAVETSDTVFIYPGERYGVIGVMPEEGVDFISVDYFDLNTGVFENTQEVPIYTEGFVQLPNQKRSNYDLTVQPNPFDQTIFMELSAAKGGKLQVSILNLNGEVIDVIDERIISNESIHHLTYSNATLSSGTYLVQVKVDGEIVLTQKIVKN